MFVLPPGSCDTHFHFFDQSRYSFTPSRSYTPSDALMLDYNSLRKQYGIDSAVLVHPSVYGADHQSFEDALRENQDWLRGVAVVYPDTSEKDIERWHALGARGARVNALFKGGPEIDGIRQIVEKIKPFGWHLQLLIDIENSPELAQQVCEMGVEVVIDHMGHHAAQALLSATGFSNVLSLLKEGRAWVKLSGPYRISGDSPAYLDVRPVVDQLLEANCKQLVWGTDWPHPSPHYPVPTDQRLVELVFEWLPDAVLREQVLVLNPKKLYWRDSIVA